MAQFGLDFKSFFDNYFRKHDEEFLANLSEIISEKDDSREIAALADWSFRNYVIEAVSLALELNNRKIYDDIMNFLSNNITEPRTRMMNTPARCVQAIKGSPGEEKPDIYGMYKSRNMPGPQKAFGGEEIYDAPPYEETEAYKQSPLWEETQQIDFNFEA